MRTCIVTDSCTPIYEFGGCLPLVPCSLPELTGVDACASARVPTHTFARILGRVRSQGSQTRANPHKSGTYSSGMFVVFVLQAGARCCKSTH